MLPDGPLVAFLGDDFTGSSAAMEVLAFAGLPTVLFLAPPTPARLAEFAGYRGIGVATTARSRSPAWMAKHLPPILALLAGVGASVLHYKVCSTFDSAPEIGSIGAAADLAIEMLRPDWVPLLTADPGMGRFQSFGHLFALAGDEGYRLDRHPTMSRHPSTPMYEADLSLHLSRQTARRIGLVDFVSAKRGEAETRLARARAEGAEIVSLDVLDRETLVVAGRLIWERAGRPALVIGSQGVEAALVASWQESGFLPVQGGAERTEPAERIAVVSGSVSPVTAAQIEHAGLNGFEPIRLDLTRIGDPSAWAAETDRAADAALDAIGRGRDPLVFSAAGPDDAALGAFAPTEANNERLGTGLGTILGDVVERAGLRRVVISGGDTSGRAAAMLGIDALTALAPLAPGSPLCRAHAAGRFDGLEIALKGGQVGQPDFFSAAKRGGA